MPIQNYDGEIVGVAQIINKKTGDHEFTANDEKVFKKYLVFCGIGLTNAQLFAMSVREYKKNQLMLDLARSIFEEQTNLDKVVHKMMRQALGLLKCSRCSVFLVDKEIDRELLRKLHQDIHEKPLWLQSCFPSPGVSQPHAISNFNFRQSTEDEPETTLSFSKVFDLTETESTIRTVSEKETKCWRNALVAYHVAETGEKMNITDMEIEENFQLEASEEPGGVHTTSLLCIPIFNSEHRVIGVCQLSNKTNGHTFDDSDVGNFETFAIFCGLGIHNTQMYESACKLMAKQAVALEVLSYHATAPLDEVRKFQVNSIPSATQMNLLSFDFNDFLLSDDETVKAAIRIFIDCGAAQNYKIPHAVLTRWVLSVKKSYRPVTYHNWRHAFNVMQTMFTMIATGKMSKYMSDLETFLLLVACICHDLDHRGTNNTFQSKIESPLARLYSTSTMEHHHFDHCILILNSEGNNILQSFSPEEYRKAIHILEAAILSTDLALYFKKRGGFLKLVEEGETDWRDETKKELLRGMMMTACDVAAITKPWEIQKDVAQLVAKEFFEQGDLERSQLNQEPIAMMDRQKRDELPTMQVGFIDAICHPVYKALADVNDGLKPLLQGCQTNRHQWQTLADDPDLRRRELSECTYNTERPSESSNRVNEQEVNGTTNNRKISEMSNGSITLARQPLPPIAPTENVSTNKKNEKKSKTCSIL